MTDTTSSPETPTASEPSPTVVMYKFFPEFWIKCPEANCTPPPVAPPVASSNCFEFTIGNDGDPLEDDSFTYLRCDGATISGSVPFGDQITVCGQSFSHEGASLTVTNTRVACSSGTPTPPTTPPVAPPTAVSYNYYRLDECDGGSQELILRTTTSYSTNTSFEFFGGCFRIYQNTTVTDWNNNPSLQIEGEGTAYANCTECEGTPPTAPPTTTPVSPTPPTTSSYYYWLAESCDGTLSDVQVRTTDPQVGNVKIAVLYNGACYEIVAGGSPNTNDITAGYDDCVACENKLSPPTAPPVAPPTAPPVAPPTAPPVAPSPVAPSPVYVAPTAPSPVYVAPTAPSPVYTPPTAPPVPAPVFTTVPVAPPTAPPVPAPVFTTSPVPAPAAPTPIPSPSPAPAPPPISTAGYVCSGNSCIYVSSGATYPNLKTCQDECEGDGVML